MTSLIKEALGGLIFTLQDFKMVNSNKLASAVLVVRFLDKRLTLKPNVVLPISDHV